MRSLKPALPLLAVSVAALALSACGVDVSVGGDDVASASITADGHTYQLKDLHIDGNSATATTKKGRHLAFEKVDGRWTVVR